MHQEELKSHKNKTSLLFFLPFFIFLISCDSNRELPIFGERELDLNGDTLYHVIPSFSFTNQFGKQVSETDYEGKVYVADFFFTTCPGTCPVMSNSLFRVQEAFKSSKEPVHMLSHTVDPETDQPKVLLEYGTEKGADFTKWNFVTGSKRLLYEQAAKYLVVAQEDVTSELHFIHSDKLVLIDRSGRIRGMYSGVNEKEVDQLIEDLKIVLTEK